jgi:hypothetical protein
MNTFHEFKDERPDHRQQAGAYPEHQALEVCLEGRFQLFQAGDILRVLFVRLVVLDSQRILDLPLVDLAIAHVLDDQGARLLRITLVLVKDHWAALWISLKSGRRAGGKREEGGSLRLPHKPCGRAHRLGRAIGARREYKYNPSIKGNVKSWPNTKRGSSTY